MLTIKRWDKHYGECLSGAADFPEFSTDVGTITMGGGPIPCNETPSTRTERISKICAALPQIVMIKSESEKLMNGTLFSSHVPSSFHFHVSE